MTVMYFLLILMLSFAGFGSTIEVSDPDFYKLQHYANFLSIVYCITKDLDSGFIRDESTHCIRLSCQAEDLSRVEVVETFNYADDGEVGSGFYALDHSSKEIILAFKGTSSRREWVSDLDLVPVEYQPLLGKDGNPPRCDGCEVHHGFYDFLKNNIVDIVRNVKKIESDHPDYELTFLGHSLGAALATLVGIEFLHLGYEPLIVAFAGPRVGNQQFVDHGNWQMNTAEVHNDIMHNKDFNKGWIRVTHKGDVVPSLPPSIFFGHGGFKYHIDKKDLPHRAEDVERHGSKFSEDISDGLITELEKIGLGKFFDKTGLRGAHTQYFLKITSCHEGEF